VEIGHRAVVVQVAGEAGQLAEHPAGGRNDWWFGMSSRVVHEWEVIDERDRRFGDGNSSSAAESGAKFFDSCVALCLIAAQQPVHRWTVRFLERASVRLQTGHEHVEISYGAELSTEPFQVDAQVVAPGRPEQIAKGP
jgi:hypothetical protein